MRIAFDAKRAFQNTTGLGHYSRTLITSLAEGFPQHTYLLMAPKQTELYKPQASNIEVITPRGISKTLSSLWRSNWVKKDLKKLETDIYHGLSHEIPVGIQHTGIRSVVTIHDLIFERYPGQYKPVDVAIYRKKFRYACRHADKIIAISGQTKDDIVQYYGIDADKIAVCYQACSPIYSEGRGAEGRRLVKEKYKLPSRYFLYIGSIIERKNLLTICMALAALRGKLDVPLVVIGNGDSDYSNKVKHYVSANHLQDSVIFLSDNPAIKNDPGFKSSADFPAIYQSALAMIYPSVYEGFGLPVLEALWSHTPVITSNLSCLPETGGDAAYYVDPLSVEQMSEAMQAIAHDAGLRKSMADKGIAHAQNFTAQKCAEKVMEVYETVMRS